MIWALVGVVALGVDARVTWWLYRRSRRRPSWSEALGVLAVINGRAT